MPELSHIDPEKGVQMADVRHKPATLRSATARTTLWLPSAVLIALQHGATLRSPKGDVFQTAILAGIMAAKKTGDLIPLCHPIGLDHCQIDIQFESEQVLAIDCTATVVSKTGVEMEALVGATIAALTIYDMCKAVSHDIIIRETKLMAKSGGKRDFKRTS